MIEVLNWIDGHWSTTILITICLLSILGELQGWLVDLIKKLRK